MPSRHRRSAHAAHAARGALATLLALAVVAGACSGDDDGGDDDGTESGGTGGTGGTSESGGDDPGGLESVTGALAVLPDSGSGEDMVTWADVSRVAEIAGVTRPDDPGDEEAVVDYLQAVSGFAAEEGAPFAAGILPEAVQAQTTPDVAGFVEDVGWSVLDVDRFAERTPPPGVVTVLEGEFDEDRLTEALGEPEDGTWRAGGGEAYEMDITDRTPARPLGQSLWLTLPGGDLTVTRSPEDSAAVDEAVTGEGASVEGAPTLADDPAFAGLAAALDEESPYAAMLVRSAPLDVLGEGASPEQAEAACEQALPEPPEAAGTAVAEDGGPVVLVALAHRSAEAAEANAAALERIATEGVTLRNNQPWSELLTLDGVDVTGDGLVAVARLRPVEPIRAALWHDILVTRDSLVASC